jgi:hypothetical protein
MWVRFAWVGIGRSLVNATTPGSHKVPEHLSLLLQSTDHELIPKGMRVLRQCKVPRAEVMFVTKAKAVPLHATKALGWRGGIAPTHSRPRR